MCHLPKENAVFPKKREQLFTELMRSGYRGAPLLEYRALLERELHRFGREKLKTTDLGQELRSLLTAFSLRCAEINRLFFPRVTGEGSFLFPTEWFEYHYCRMLAASVAAARGQTVYTDLQIDRGLLRVGIYYIGKQLPALRAGYLAQREKQAVRICFQMKLTGAERGCYQSPRMFLCDRLSPVSLAFL